MPNFTVMCISYCHHDHTNPFPYHGKILHTTVHQMCSLECQILPESVYFIALGGNRHQIWPVLTDILWWRYLAEQRRSLTRVCNNERSPDLSERYQNCF